MEIKQINDQLRNDAIKFGLCQQWQDEWKEDWSQEKMVEKMFKGIDFCLKYRYPSNQFIKDNFDLDFRRKSNVLVDDRYSLLNPPYALILGDSKATIRLNGRKSSIIYIHDWSRVELYASGSSFAIVHLLGDSRIEVEKKDRAHIAVISHSNDARLFASDPTVTFEKELNWPKIK